LNGSLDVIQNISSVKSVELSKILEVAVFTEKTTSFKDEGHVTHSLLRKSLYTAPACTLEHSDYESLQESTTNMFCNSSNIVSIS
jgi:hypothetical protein